MEKFISKTFWTELLNKGQEWLVSELPGLIIVLLIFILTLRIVRFSIKKLKKTLIKRAEKSKTTDTAESTKRINTLVGIIHGLIRIVLWAILIMIILSKVGVNIGPILASAGIVGLAVGFGAQELVRDFISGFFIILENQIRNDDVAIINGTGGLVEKIDLRTTTLRDFSGTVHVFQNGKINTMSNMTKDWSSMVFDIGVAYKEKTEEVMQLMKQTGDELQNDPKFKDNILEPIEIFGLNEFADSAIIIKARFKTVPGQQWTIGREYRKRLKDLFDEKNIEIPFPHTTIYWGDKTGPLKLDLNDKTRDKIK